MATVDGLPPDPLSLLRRTIAANSLPIPTTDSDPNTQAQSNASLAQASFLVFNFNTPQEGAQHISIPLTQTTRFISPAAGEKPLDLRSVYFCWLHKDSTTAEYITAVQALNDELRQAGKDEAITNVVFAEKLDLNTWLAGEVGEHDSEHIKSLDDNREARLEARDAAKHAAGGEDVEMRDVGGTDEVKRKEEEERLRLIYASERRMGDHNTVLRGGKIQDFSGVRKYSQLFLGKTKPAGASAPQQPTLNPNPALRPPVKPAQSGRRLEPIILLSPSASSLVRMPNIKSFLDTGEYSPVMPGSDSPTILHISRALKTIHPNSQTRFILVDDPTNFRPDYWSRVVAVFTTGQTWQFKGYKWQNPAELFSHAMGIYVGWKGEKVPETVKGWGRGVLSVQIEKGTQRWRDREVVEHIWSQLEIRMRAQGWGRDGK
ncbi:CDC73-domain-containing protein [Dissoconium aciculare CBS 342.82]|uniref:CDC73-domain-containing protein n=1 Tax=Dissoconium aciculare CBS 342.82 TaxID=1314786 RepID=A0A6J3LXV3_9PEZI|nr:CDC73-domain-containing protein [Dissoconium aciculare CBS 342.82]KAF1819467.1 CDC73-domain-containing protein [Dissoconium aciculare CBS 342.82]